MRFVKVHDDSSDSHKRARWEIVVTILVLILALFCVIGAGIWVNPKTTSERMNFAQFVAQAIGGLVLITGLIFTAKTVRTSQETLKIAVEKQELDRKMHELERASRLSDRFQRASEQLGKAEEDARIGALYNLERVATDSDTDYDAVIELICAFVRRRSRALVANVKELGPSHIPDSVPVAPQDIEVAMTLLGRRRRTLGAGENKRLDLTGSYLCKLEINAAEFQGADFSNSLLIETKFQSCNFAECRFDRADLRQSIWFNPILLSSTFMWSDACSSLFDFDPSLPDPMYRTAFRVSTGTERLTNVYYERDPTRARGSVNGGHYLEGSSWLGAKMQDAAFMSTQALLACDYSEDACAEELDLSGLCHLTIEQWNSFDKPEKVKAPRLRVNPLRDRLPTQ